MSESSIREAQVVIRDLINEVSRAITDNHKSGFELSLISRKLYFASKLLDGATDEEIREYREIIQQHTARGGIYD